MSKLLLIILFILLIFNLQAQPAWRWARNITGTGTNTVTLVHANTLNQVFLAGYFSGTITVGADTLTSVGGNDAFIAVIDSNGNWQWAVSFGGVGNEYIYHIITDEENNIWISGIFNQAFNLGTHILNTNGNNDIFIAKLSTQGQWENAISLGSVNDDYAGGLAISADGSVYIAGVYSGAIQLGTTLLSSSSANVFISKWNAGLNNVWAQQLNNYNNYINCKKIGTDIHGNCYLIGDYDYLCSFGVVNPITITSLHMDTYVAKLDSAGNFAWAVKAGTGGTALTDGYVDSDGSCYVTTTMVGFPAKVIGNSRLDIDVTIAKLNSDGIWQWWEPTNDMGYCISNKASTDSAHNCYMTGELWGVQTFGTDTLTGGFANGVYNENLYLAKAAPDGTWQWGLQTFNGGFSWEGAPFVYDIAALQSANCIITGRYKQRGVDFGNIIIPPAQQYSSFVAMGGTEPTSNIDLTENMIPVIHVYPNPSSANLTIEFELEKAQNVSLSVYNIKGQFVKKFTPGLMNKGKNNFVWNGETQTGNNTSPGIYIIKLTTEKGSTTKLLVRK